MTLSAESKRLHILESKCRVPLVPGDILPRPRLFQELNDWRTRRLTIVQAPPGYGKTMLVASWLHYHKETLSEQGIGVGWLSLDEGDDDPRQFMAHFAVALEPVIPEATRVVEQNLLHGQADLQQSIKILLNAISGLTTPILMVIDDYHHIENERIRQVVRHMLKRGPTNLHWILLSRRDLIESLGHMSDIGGLRLLGTEELRLEKDEVARFLERVLAAERPSESELAALVAQSDGWIAGFRLAAFSMPQGGDVAALTARLQSHNQWLSTFFRSEFLANLPTHLQAFLLQTSILEQLNGPLCMAVTGMPDAASLLEQAAATNLFITPTNAAMTRFAYHDLFRRMLRDELIRRFPPLEVQALCQRAGRWLEENDEIGAALRQFVSAGFEEAAIDLVERHSLPTILAGDLQRPLSWLSQLTKEGLLPSPRLLLDQGWLYLIADRLDTLAFLQSTQQAWLEQAQSSEFGIHWRQERQIQWSVAHYLAGDSEKALAIAEQIGAGLSADSHFLVSGCYHFLNAINLLNPPDKAEYHCRQALQIYETHGWLTGMVAASRAMSLNARYTGKAQEALAFGRRAQRLIKETNQDLTLEAVYIHQNLAHVLYNLNQIEETKDELRQMIAKTEMLGEEELAYLGRIIMTLCDLGEGDMKSSSSIFNSTSQQKMMHNIKPTRQLAIYSWLSRYWILTKKNSEAWQVARQLPIKPDDSPRDHHIAVSIIFVSGYLAQGINLDQLESFMLELDDLCTEMGRNEWRLQSDILQAWFWLKRGISVKAKRYTNQALDLVQQTGYVRYVLDIPELNSLLITMDQSTIQSYPELSIGANGLYPSEPLTAQEIEILRLLAERRKNAEIADKLYISVSTVKWHLWNIYRKMGVRNRRGAVDLAQNIGLIPK